MRSNLISAALLAIAFSGIRAWPQTQSQLTGTVMDTSGAVAPGAAVTARNSDTGVAQTVSANGAGVYAMPFLQPGRYEVTCEMDGFKRLVRGGIVLETGGTHTVDFRLELGAVTETVVVKASSPILESESSSVGQFIEHTTIANMPVESRRVGALVRLMGNVIYREEALGEAIPRFTMGGGRPANQMWNLDGGVVQNITLGTAELMLNPPAESLQEFRAEVNNFPAEFGRAGSGLILMSTRSGTNRFHGAAYEFLRNDVLDARTFFAGRKAPLRYNIFGVSAGGPIIKDKMFFFFNYEGARRRDGLTYADTIVPNPREVTGDFSARRDLTVLDPTTKQPFAGNIIPASRLDPVCNGPVCFPPPKAETIMINSPGDSLRNRLWRIARFDRRHSDFSGEAPERRPWAFKREDRPKGAPNLLVVTHCIQGETT